jgi:RHS repeat-associated protein
MFLTDALGSLVATTDSAGGVQSEVTYEPFGATELSSAAPAYRFTGREHDEPLYLYYYRARYYHTDLQRFISEDPSGFHDQEYNLFVYVANNPLGFVDPLGLWRWPWNIYVDAENAAASAASTTITGGAQNDAYKHCLARVVGRRQSMVCLVSPSPSSRVGVMRCGGI